MVMPIRETVFIVDDDPIVLKVARNALMAQFDVITIPDSRKLFALLEKTKPQLILLDILLDEDEDGYAVLKKLKEQEDTKEIPVIFLTSLSAVDDEMKGLTIGAVDYVAKPFVPQVLQKRVELHMQLSRQQNELNAFNENLVQMVQDKTQDLRHLQESLLMAISNVVEFRDDITGGHINRTERLLRVILETAQERQVYMDEISTWDTELILRSSLLHDVGKIHIPDAVLLKPGKLDFNEFEIMKTHAEKGGELIEKLQRDCGDSWFLSKAKVLAVSHHEKWDGSGYPYGLAGQDIPLPGRLMAFADVYDALISKRPYKEPFTHEEALKIISDVYDTQFDPALREVFFSAADRFNAERSAGVI
jgi:putative two-component system response regulator